MSEEEKKNHEEKNDESKEKETNDETKSEQEKLEELMRLMKELEKTKEASNKKGKKRRPPVIMIEFGSAFSHIGAFNFMMYFLLNLVVIYTIVELTDFASFSGGLVSVLLFVLAYSLAEMLFRNYVMMNHFKFVLRTLGFIFFFGYLTIFYLLERYLFTDSFAFTNETLLVVFVGMFITVRYLLSHLIRNQVLRQRKW